MCFTLDVKKGKQVKMKVYSLISSLLSDFYIFTPWSLNCLFVYHFNFTESMQSRRHFGALHLSYTLPPMSYQVLIFTSSQVNHLRAKCLSTGLNIETMSQYWEGRNMIFLWKSCTKWDSKPHGSQAATCTLVIFHERQQLEMSKWKNKSTLHNVVTGNPFEWLFGEKNVI